MSYPRAGAAEADAAIASREAPGRGLSYRGVAYDTGTNFETGQGPLSRAVWSIPRM